MEIVANGRADWIGWVELTTEPADELALRHTAMVRTLGADVLGVVEADDRTTLQRFSDCLLADVGGTPYEQVLLVDGNDDRGIDVGVMVRAPLTIAHLRTHVFDRDADGVVFSRDCCEYHLRTPDGGGLAVLVNHFKSKGYSEPGDRPGAGRRRRQAVRAAEIYRGLRAEGIDRVASSATSTTAWTAPSRPAARRHRPARPSASTPDFDFGLRRGTFQGGNEASKFDDVLLSPALFKRPPAAPRSAAACGTGRARPTPWEMYDTLTAEVHCRPATTPA